MDDVAPRAGAHGEEQQRRLRSEMAAPRGAAQRLYLRAIVVAKALLIACVCLATRARHRATPLGLASSPQAPAHPRRLGYARRPSGDRLPRRQMMRARAGTDARQR